MSYFEVDRDGLAKLIAGRGKEFVLFELLQNAWDQNVTEVRMTFEKVPNRPLAKVVVEDDDPDGFSDLSHAYTLFAESEKKSNPEQRGRFNLGEKLVLALCKSATISTTKGTIIFTEDGDRKRGKTKREKGSVVEAYVKMNQTEFDHAEKQVWTLIPDGIPTYINGKLLEPRTPITTFEATLTTERSDDDGILRRTKRKTKVSVYEPKPGETPHLYEMGIPVVEFDRFHVDISQKIPLNSDRDNVTPAYKRELRALVLANAHSHLTEEDSAESWVSDAMENPLMEHHPEAVDAVLTSRYGEKRATYDPSDPEANNRLVSEGYSLIHGRSFGKTGWSNIKTTGAAIPSGTLRPTPKAYSDDPNADPVNILDRGDWTEGMLIIERIAETLAKRLMGLDISVSVVCPPVMACHWSACWGKREIDFNRTVLGKRWFDENRNPEEVVRLLIHEFAHHYCSNHLDDRFYKAINKLGAKLAILLSKEPELIEGL